jgi:iron complex transport system substrate-binding protein
MKFSGSRFPIALMPLFLIAIMAMPVNVNGAINSHQEEPRRIISLSPATTEALYLLGLEKNLIAVTIYCRKPPGAQEKEKIGSIMAPDIEKIVSLKPNLVIAMSLTDIREIRKLKNLGLHVVTFRIPRNCSQLCDVFLERGKIVGKPKEAALLVNESKKRVSSIGSRVKSLPRQKTLVQIGSRPLFAATKDFFLNDYVEFAGGTNIFRDAGSGAISMEEAVKRDPDVILIATMGMSGESERELWKRFPTMKAVKNNRIHVVDADKLCSPTPISFAEYLTEIVYILHPRG